MHTQPYIPKPHYYETDQMGIIHHSNYIRWFEEARTDLLEQLGLPYQQLAERGLNAAMLSVSCEYKSMVRFGDTLRIEACIHMFNGVKMRIVYRVYDDATGALRTTGMTHHCFITAQGRPVSLQKCAPDIYAFLRGVTVPAPEEE